MKTSGLDWLAVLLTVFGAVTWGIIGVTGLMGEPINVVALALEPVFRPGPALTVEYVIYLLVGIAGVYLLFTAYKMGRASRRATKERRRSRSETAPPETTRPEMSRSETATDADAENTNTES